VLEFEEFQVGAMKKAVVLIVEKDRTSSQEAIEALREAGFEVVEADEAAAGLRMIYETRPDVIVASADLSAVNGEDAFLRLRQASYLPMIAIGSREEVVEMLEMGMDACIISPPTSREVVARVQSLLVRQGRGEPPGGGSFPGEGGFHFRGRDNGGLSRTEYRLSSYLISHRGRLLDYPRLISEVWGGKSVSLDTLHFYIRSLRRKLAGFDIFSVRGVGYGLYEGSE